MTSLINLETPTASVAGELRSLRCFGHLRGGKRPLRIPKHDDAADTGLWRARRKLSRTTTKLHETCEATARRVLVPGVSQECTQTGAERPVTLGQRLRVPGQDQRRLPTTKSQLEGLRDGVEWSDHCHGRSRRPTGRKGGCIW